MPRAFFLTWLLPGRAGAVAGDVVLRRCVCGLSVFLLRTALLRVAMRHARPGPLASLVGGSKSLAFRQVPMQADSKADGSGVLFVGSSFRLCLSGQSSRWRCCTIHGRDLWPLVLGARESLWPFARTGQCRPTARPTAVRFSCFP